MGKLLVLRKLEVDLDLDLEELTQAQWAPVQRFIDSVEALIETVGMPWQRNVSVRVVPTEELLALLSTGRAFRVESDFVVGIDGGAKTFAPGADGGAA